MNYFYYPGCSLEGTAREYNLSTRSLMAVLGAELMEIDGWACCGASAAHAESELLSWVLPARTLALAEKMGRERRENLDILVPCSACYLNLKKVSETARFDAGLLKKINTVLEEDGLVFENRLKVRHLLDVLTRDIDISDIEHRKSTTVLKVLPLPPITDASACGPIRYLTIRKSPYPWKS